MAEKKNNNVWYIIGGVVILAIVLANYVNAETRQVQCTSYGGCGSNQVCDAMTHTCIDVQPGQVQVGSPALCVENDIYTENNCIKKCIDGTKKDLKCCGQGETVTWNENNKNDAFGGYYCYSSQTQSNNSSQSNSNTLIIAGAIIVGFIILAIILSRRKKK